MPDAVTALYWDGAGEPPTGIGATEVYVPIYGPGPPRGDALAYLPNLRLIQLLTAGVDRWLPLVPPGVMLCDGRGIHSTSTAELAITLILADVRGLPRFIRDQDARRWQPQSTDELAGKRVLIVGAGDIGEHIARRLEPFEVSITRVARSRRDGVHGVADLPGLLPDHDVVVLVVPLTDETRGMVDARFLAAMPDGALLVNVARGPVVDTDALLDELRSGRLHAALDVTDPEPPPPDHPLWQTPNLLLTPHVAGGTYGWVRRAYRLVEEQLRRYLAGEPLLNVVAGDY